MSDSTHPELGRFLRLPDVEKEVGLSKAMIYKLIARELFPKSRKYIGLDGVFWPEVDILAWKQKQLAAAA